MQVVDLNGNIVQWNLKLNNRKIYAQRSKLHLQTRKILTQEFPTLRILEEVPIKPIQKCTLFLDFYIPLISLVVEVHGQQHYKYIPHFHTNPQAYSRQQTRDAQKEQWCQLNKMRFIVFAYNESIETWIHKLHHD